MNIGIIGSGDVALALGTGFIKEGHAAKVSSRDPSKAKITEWIQAQGAQASVGSFSDAAKFGEVLVIATHWEGGATQNAIEMAGKENFNGKVVIDVTNPLDFSKGMPPTLEVSGNNSACEMIQSWLPQAKVVKAFNTVSNLNMYKPMFESRPDMFICGNDEAAKKTVSMILEKFGWGTLDIGDVKAARYIESVAMAYILHAIRTNNWNAALKLLHK